MNGLAPTELKTFNGLSQFYDPSIKLGDKIQEVITALNNLTPAPIVDPIEEGTPINAIAAKGTLTLTGVVVHGETVEIGEDVYQFSADDLQTITRPEFIPVNITPHVVEATGELTMAVQPVAGDTLTLATKVFTFVPVGTDTADGEVSIGEDLAGAQAALVAAINGTDGVNDPHTLVSAGAFVANVLTLSALIGGIAGNDIDTTETFTAETNVFAAAKLAGGGDCTAPNAILALVAAITAFDTQGVGAVDGADDTIVLTADIAGVAGNAITIATDMINASFGQGVTTLSGGTNGTVAIGKKFMVDATYLYICLNGNAATGTNWRRVSLGAAF